MAGLLNYCVIKSRLSGLVLDIEGASLNAGARVIPWQRNDQVNQIWYEDTMTGTIRSKLNGHCLDIRDNQLVVNPYVPGQPYQQWYRHGDCIRNRTDFNLVLDVFECNTKPGAKISAYQFHGDINQLWDFEYLCGQPSVAASTSTPSIPSHPRGYFSIASDLDFKVVTIRGGCPAQGTPIIVYPMNYPVTKNQLWYFDHDGYIRSALNDFVFANFATGDRLTMVPYGSNTRGHWKAYKESNQSYKIYQDGVGECLTIPSPSQEAEPELRSDHYRGSANQNWQFKYE